jgi:hypothetical protein
MIKIDYEGCWKQFKQEAKEHKIYDDTLSELDRIEKNNTRDFIELKRREPEDQIDYIMKKYTEKYIEVETLKKELKDIKEGNRDFIPNQKEIEILKEKILKQVYTETIEDKVKLINIIKY